MATLKVTNIKNESFAGDQLYLKTDGTIGIGTTSPANKLHVVGTTKLFGTTAIGGSDDITPSATGVGQLTIDGNGYTGYIAQDATAMYFGHNSSSRHLVLQTNETDRIKIHSSTGKVGIGTTNPLNRLHVVSTNYQTIRCENDDNGSDGPYLEMYTNSSSPAVNDYSGIFSFKNRNSAAEEITYSQIRTRVDNVTDGSETGHISFHTRHSGTFGERLKIVSDGNIHIPDGNLVLANTHGIDFSATADAGASASNIYEILDDYEEGYFTPNIQPVTSGSITWVGTADLLSYTKIGRIVHIKGMLEVDSVSSPTGITRGTLPFTQASLTDESERTSGVCIITGTNIAAGSYALYPNGGTDSYLEPIRIGNSADIERDAGSYLGAGDKLYFSYTYQASA